MATRQEMLDACMAMIERAARAGERCPTLPQIAAEMRRLGLGTPDNAVPDLANAGKIRIEVGGKNWRVVKILTGPANGLHTAYPDTSRPWKPYVIIGASGREVARSRLLHATARS